jgi:hypothetical protein
MMVSSAGINLCSVKHEGDPEVFLIKWVVFRCEARTTGAVLLLTLSDSFTARTTGGAKHPPKSRYGPPPIAETGGKDDVRFLTVLPVTTEVQWA